jgi:hypothetical protein
MKCPEYTKQGRNETWCHKKGMLILKREISKESKPLSTHCYIPF